MTTRPFKTKAAAFRYLNNCCNNDVSFIANVILAQTSKKAKRLKALARLVDNGAIVTTAPFTMPYKGFRVNGIFRTMEDVLD